LQRLDEEAAHVVIVLRKQNLGGNLDRGLHRCLLARLATLRRPSKDFLKRRARLASRRLSAL
jgi:hypothetical protein